MKSFLLLLLLSIININAGFEYDPVTKSYRTTMINPRINPFVYDQLARMVRGVYRGCIDEGLDVHDILEETVQALKEQGTPEAEQLASDIRDMGY